MEYLKRNQVFQSEYELLDKARCTAQSRDFMDNPMYSQYNELLQGYTKLLQQSVGLVSIGDKQQEHLYKLQSDLKNILDHTGQGIFTVNQELIIHKGYSLECKTIFGEKIEGKKFSQLIGSSNDVEKIKLIESVLNSQFFHADPFQQRVMLMLLPDELRMNEKIYRVKYKPVTLELKEKLENAFMIILTDITEKKILQKAMDDERRVFKTVTKIISNLKLFRGCIKEYHYFYEQKLPGLLRDDTADLSKIVNEIFREVHTLKGNFAIFEFPWLVGFLEEVEQALTVVRENVGRVSFPEFLRVIREFNFRKAIEDSMQQVYRVIGDQWVFDRDFVMVKTEDIKALALKIEKADPLVAAELKKVCDVDILELLRTYPEYTQHLAERLGKNVAPFTIEYPEEIRLDPDQYEEFTRSLIHVFRNMVDHGMETPEERFAAGKDEVGNIRCSVQKEKNGFRISITDDGRGIDVESLKQKAVQCGMVTAESALRMPFDQALLLIFHDGLSTSGGQNGISGRGVGLAKVKYEIDRLGGTIEIKTKLGGGTSFIFHLLL